jgi:hypothetical protein
MSADSVPSSKTNIFQRNSIHSSIVPILELIRGAQCLIEVIRSSGEEMWRVDAYQIPYYSRGIEEAKRTHPRFADCQFHVTAAIMVQRSIGVKKRKQDVIAFVNTVTEFIHLGSYAHIVTVVRKWISWWGK